MTTIEKHIVKYIDDKFGFPYLFYDKTEQTWYNEFFLYDIKQKTMFVSDEVKENLCQKFGKNYIEQVLLNVVNHWFKKIYNLSVESIK